MTTFTHVMAEMLPGYLIIHIIISVILGIPARRQNKYPKWWGYLLAFLLGWIASSVIFGVRYNTLETYTYLLIPIIPAFISITVMYIFTKPIRHND